MKNKPPYLFTTTTKASGVITEKFLEEQFEKVKLASNLCEHSRLKGQCPVEDCEHAITDNPS